MTEAIHRPVLQAQLERLAPLAGAIGEPLIGLYLHGSAVLGGWRPEISDLDLLAVVADHAPVPDPARVDRVCRRSAVPVELSVITVSTAAGRHADCWPFLLHVATSADRVITDDGRGDPDLLMHAAVCRAHGRALVGPPVTDVFSPIGSSVVAGYLADELGWALTSASATYAVLNSCRAARWLHDGALVSKVSGGQWALQHLPQHAPSIRSALAAQRSGSRRPGRPGEADRALLVEVRAALVARRAMDAGSTHGS